MVCSEPLRVRHRRRHQSPLDAAGFPIGKIAEPFQLQKKQGARRDDSDQRDKEHHGVNVGSRLGTRDRSA